MRRLLIGVLFWSLGLALPARAQSPVEAQLALARSQFEAQNYEAAAAALDPLVVALEALASRDRVAAALLPNAYELRARSRFQLGNTDGANADFQALLRAAPGYVLSGQVPQRVTRLFEDVRKANVGKMVLNLAPSDAEIELDGAPFTPVAGEIPLFVGSHTLSGRRPGCRSASQTFSVVAGAVTEVVLTLERVSASLGIVTSPPGVEVVVDGVSKGRTETGALTPQWSEPVARLGAPANLVSKPFIVDDLGNGVHAVEFLRDCHVKETRQVVVDKPADFLLDPVKLEKAVASLRVESPTPGASVLLNGESRGPAPFSADDVCEGDYVVELRSSWGRYVERITARPGDKLKVRGAMRPAVALLGVTGLPEGSRGPDLRLALEKSFATVRSMTMFVPAADKVRQALEAERLSPGWLAFDRWRRPLGAIASAITPAVRLETGSRLARALDVQAVAELTARPGGERGQFLLALLAAGSSEPDVLELNLDDPASLNGVIALLDSLPTMRGPSVGLTVADVLDVRGAVVIGVEAGGAGAKAGLAPGDVITKVDDEALVDGGAFAAAVARRKAGDALAVEVQDRSGAVKPAALAVAMTPRLVAPSDRSLPFNTILVGLRPRLAESSTPDEVVRLNVAAALMGLGNWAEARSELSKVRLPAGPGVSNGTVQYLLGLCLEALGQAADAEAAWRAAAADDESRLTEDGPAVKELAERKLAGRK